MHPPPPPLRFFGVFSWTKNIKNIKPDVLSLPRIFRQVKWFCFCNEFGEMKLCRIFASRFCKYQSWNAEFLHHPFVVDFLMNLAEKWNCKIFASRFCKCQSWNAEFLHHLFVVDSLMNLAEIWLCKIFASRFLSWNAEFLNDPFFVVDFVKNLEGKWLCRIFASSL